MSEHASRPPIEHSLDLVNVVIVSIGADQRITFINRKGRELLGRPAAALIGADWFETCLPAEDRDATRDVFRRLLDGEVDPAAYHENEIVAAGGERRLIAWHNSYLRDDEGRICGTLSAGDDITERRAQKLDLEHAHRQFLAVLDNLQAVVYVADMQTHELLFTNRFTREGVPGAELGAKCWQTLQAGQDEPCGFCTNDKLVDADGEPCGPWEWEFQNTVTGRWYLCKDSAIRWVDGRLVRLEIAYDITEKKQQDEERLALERRLQQSRRMESLGVLTGGIAHDFNNILLAVQGNADLAREALDPQHPATARLDDVLRASRRAADLCRQMLLYAGRTEPKKKPVQLDAIVRETAELMRVTLPPDTRVELDVAADLPAIEADPTQIRQVIMNLVTNAVESVGQDDGRISVAVKEIELEGTELRCNICREALADGTYVLLDVVDKGDGMDANTLERIGEPFYSTKFPGRGLGLAVVCGVVGSHDCHLTVDSAPGEGSTFRIYFRAAAAADGETVPPVSVAADGEWADMDGFTVLLVDDEEEVRNIGGRMLEQLGCEVVTVDSGLGALDLLAGDGPRPDAVLLDATMPGLSGVETLREIRAREPELSVIMTSGHPREVVLAPASGIVPDAFLGKPYFLENLARTLDEVRLRRRA